MPYCAQCGKLITEEIVMKNKGECDDCVQKSKKIDPQLIQPSTQSSTAKLESCAYCSILTSVHCENCHKPICQKHIVVSHMRGIDEDILCQDCCSKKENRHFKWTCIGISIFLIFFFTIMIKDLI